MYIIKENNKKQTIKALSRPIYLLKKSHIIQVAKLFSDSKEFSVRVRPGLKGIVQDHESD